MQSTWPVEISVSRSAVGASTNWMSLSLWPSCLAT